VLQEEKVLAKRWFEGFELGIRGPPQV
jgi:hypothetical protein